MNSLSLLGLAATAAILAAAPRGADPAAPSELVAYHAGTPPQIRDAETLARDGQPVDEAHCQLHASMAETLRHDFAEHPLLTRVAGDGLVMELWTSEVMATWTILHKGADGVSCIVSSGTGWVSGTAPDLAFARAGLAG